MIASNFPEANTKFGPPADLEESQCSTVPAFVGQLRGGSVDGATVVVTAWKPTQEDIENIQKGGCVFLSCLGGLPPHYIGTSFKEVTNIA